jgi:hypothetical protein
MAESASQLESPPRNISADVLRKRKRENRGGSTSPWLANPLGYYQEHYPGVTRNKLRSVNDALYMLLRRRGFLGSVPYSYPSDEEVRAEYRNRYAGLNRTELRKKDPVFYKKLLRHNLLKIVPPKPPKAIERKRQGKELPANSPKDNPWLDDPKRYYEKNYPGMTRGKLMEANRDFFDFLKSQDWIVQVPIR